MARKSHAQSPVEYDRDALVAELQSRDEFTRQRAVRMICPCRLGWEAFQQCMGLVRKLQKDPSARVRRAALHVFEDAFEMDSSGQPTRRQEVTNEMAARRRELRWRTEEEDAPDPVDRDLWKRERDRERERKWEKAGAYGTVHKALDPKPRGYRSQP